MNKKTFLCDIMPNESATVLSVSSDEDMRKRFFDIGLIIGSEVKCVGESPSGDPRAYLIQGAVIAIRQKDSALISVLRK